MLINRSNAKKSVFTLFLWLLVALTAGGCGTGGETSASTANDVQDDETADLLADVRFWMYQIQNQEAPGNIQRLAESRYDLLVIDQTRSLVGEESYDSRTDVEQIRSSASSSGGSKLVICYVDVGEAESYRSYWQEGWRVGNPEWIVAPDPDGWDENYPVKFWRSEWKDIVKSRLDQIIEDGYDGFYLDWLEIYSLEPVAAAARAEGLDPRAELTKFVGELRDHTRARKPGFLFIAQNAAELGDDPAYVSLFDAIAQEAVWFDGAGDPDTADQPGDVPNDVSLTNDYISNLQEWRRQGKLVLNAEYAQQPGNANRAYELGARQGFITLVTLRPLDSLTATPPPGY